MAALWREQLPLNDSSRQHLESCLLCRACEAVCPADVPFESVMNRTRANMAATGSASPMKRGLDLLLNKPLLRLGTRALRWYQRLGLQRLARATGLLRRLGLARADALLPPLASPTPWRPNYRAAAQPARGMVALFTGCVSDLIDRDATSATIALLTAGGYDVTVPPAQTCCGALHAHSGDLATAATQRATNEHAFSTAASSAILSVTPGCTATLKELDRACAAAPVHDACEFFARHELPATLDFKPLPQRIALHTPCSQRTLGGNAHIKKLLSAIPELNVVTIDHKLCCGAAGSHMLSHPHDADALMDLTLDAIEQSQPDLIVTTNVGCSILMRHALRQRGSTIEIVHPLTLLQRQFDGPRDILQKTTSR